jgi:hypothetical protein
MISETPSDLLLPGRDDRIRTCDPLTPGILQHRSASISNGSDLHRQSTNVRGRPSEYTGVVTQLVTHPAARSTPCGRSGPHLTSAPPRQARRELCPPEFGAHPPLDWSGRSRPTQPPRRPIVG